MNMEDRYELPAVLDMGNSAIRVLVADARADGSLIVAGIGEEASAGMDEGRIVDLEKATAALQRAVRTAEIDSGRKLGPVLAAVSGEHLRSHAAEGKVVIAGSAAQGGDDDDTHFVEGGVVSAHDIHKVREMGIAAHCGAEVEVLDVIDRTFALDKHHNIRNPLGMKGRLLTGHMHVITAERQCLENMEKCINQAGMTLAGRVVFSGLAAAQAVLKEEEKRAGVCLLDIGAQTTEMLVFYNGGVVETDVYLEAADLIHKDISIVHHTTLASAEKCKKQVGVNVPPTGDETLQLISTSGEQVEISHSLLLRTATSRVEALLEEVGRVLQRFEQQEQRKLTAGIVLAGGGALLPGMAAMVTNRLHIPVRVGNPAYGGEKHERLRTPAFACALGLLMMGRAQAAARRKQPLLARLKGFFFPSHQHHKEKPHGY